MRSLILSLFFVAISIVSYGQADPLCLTAEASPTALVPAPSAMVTLNIDASWTSDVDYIPPGSPSGALSVGYFSFTVDVNGYYTINLETSAGMTIATDVSIGLSDDSGGTACPIDANISEIFSGILPVEGGTPESGGCTFFTAGTVYTIAMAVEQGNEGEVVLTIVDGVGAPNEDCASPGTLAIGGNPGDNSCSDGFVWYSYVVVNGGSVVVDILSGSGANPITTPVINQVIFNDCANTAESMTTWPCLAPGTELLIEAGHATEQGDFEITIDDDPSPVPNDLCGAAVAQPAPTCMTTNLSVTDNTTSGACQELIDYGTCGIFNANETVWYAFTTDADAVTVDIEIVAGTMTNPSFVLIEDDGSGCASPAMIGCNMTGMVTGQAVSANTDYFIGVASADDTGAGTFTLNVTPQNPPTNDLCTDALDISSTASAGVMGTTACATEDANGFCTMTDDDHTVYYTYTVDAGITTNRTVTIDIVGSGTAATGLVFALFTDCAGTIYDNMPSTGDPCDLSTTSSVEYECVAPGTVFTIAVSTPTAGQGEFTLTITEDASSVATNDLCAGATPLSLGTICEPTSETTNNTGACPEATDQGVIGCDLTTDKVAWYTLTLPANATELDITDIGAGGQLSFFDGACPNPSVLTSVGGLTCLTGDDSFTGLTGGGTYFVAVSLAAEAEGDITFTWTPGIVVDNDDCNIGTNPALTNGTPVDGTTACADGEFDFCGLAGATSHGVFYTYTNSTGANLDLDITVTANTNTSGTAMTGLEIAVLTDCGGTLYQTADCSAALGTAYNVDCIANGDQIIIYVASNDGEEGDFLIVVTEDTTQPADNNDECATPHAIDADIILACDWNTINGSTADACPEGFFVGACAFNTDATVWYSFTTPNTTNSLSVEIRDIVGTGAAYMTILDDNCGSPTAIGGCDTGAGPFGPYTLMSNTTYHIAFGDPMEGAHSFDIKINETPANDDPCTPEAVAGLAGDVDVTVPGTTFCASDDFLEPSCGTANENSVWYEYTLPADATGLEITVAGTGGTPASNVAVGAYETSACAGAPTALDASVGVECDATTNPLTYQCLTPGTTIFVYVSTEAASAGDFDITFNPTVPDPTCIDNDLCANADVTSNISSIVTDDPQVCVSDCNIGACPEDFNTGLCGYAAFPTVFYSVTTDAAAIDATMSVTLTGTNGTTDVIFSVYTDACTSPPTPVDGTSGCIESGILTGLDIMPSTTYIIAVAVEDVAGGDFELCVTVSTTCNDDPCTPFELTNGVTADDCTTTVGSTMDETYDNGGCGDATLSEATVYFTYIPSENVSEASIVFTNDAAMGITSDVVITALEYDVVNCAITQTTILDQDCGPAGGINPLTISCPTFNEPILIQVGSTTAGAGEFDIIVNETLSTIPNDICSTPTVAAVASCEWIDLTAATLGACPESYDFDSDCGFDTNPVVYFEATAPTGAIGFDIRVLASSDGTPFIGVFPGAPTDCANLDDNALFGCQSGPFEDLDAIGADFIDAMPGDVILIGVGTDDLISGNVNFSIRWIVPPVNDECANAIQLTDENSVNGTTSCATQEDPAFNSTACTPDDQVNTVWYQVIVPDGMKGFNLTLTAAGAMPYMGDANIVVFETDACATDGTTVLDPQICATSGMLETDFECVGPGTYTIRISTSPDNEGDFTIEADILDLVHSNDLCSDPDVSLNPGLECTWMPATANTIGDCPETFNLGGCTFDQFPTVFYEITAPAGAIALDLSIDASSAGVPFMAVYDANPVDCDNLNPVAGSDCYGGIFESLSEIPADLVTVTPGNSYLIAISADDLAGSEIDFEIKWIIPPANDECVMAETLSGGASTMGTTACATTPTGGEYNSGVCTDQDETNTVWYEYTVPDGDKGFNVTITASAVDGLMGDINLVVFEASSADCTGANATNLSDEVCTTSTTINEEFECVGPGTYLIRVATSGANEGGFDILIEPLAEDAVDANDFCDGPDIDAFMDMLECEWMVYDANTANACPESFDFVSDCGFDDFPVVWYEATSPPTADFLDLQINFGGVNPFIAVFENPNPIDCENLTAISNCETGSFATLGDANLIDIDPNTSYLIGIGTDSDAGGTINFGIKWITPPDNDACDMAEELTPTMAGAGPGEMTTGLIPGTTQCATGAITGTACDDDKVNTVWYTYTVEADVKEITIDVTNWVNTVATGTPDFSVAVFDGCLPATFLNQADGTVADYCGGEGVELIKLSCIDEGDVITILVSSSAENEGMFDITLNTSMPNCTYTNDECPDAEVYSGAPIIMDDPADCVFVPGCNDLACTEFDFSAACPGIDVLNSVFYTFTTDDLLGGDGMPVDAAFVNIEIINGEAGELDSPGAILLEGDCASPAVIGACAGTGSTGEFTSGPLGMPGQIMPNTTYTVVVYNSDVDQNGGTFDLCITVSSGCVNDEPCDAFTLDPGITVTNPASTENCTPEISLAGCDPSLDEATLWYQIDIPEGFTGFDVTLVNVAAPDGVVGDISIAVGLLENCNAINPADVLYGDCQGFTTNGGVHNIKCASEFGTYYIQLGSADEMDAGDFEITVEPVNDAMPENDICSQAQDISISDFCTFVPTQGTLLDACPELNDNAACLFSENPAVWYTITIPDVMPAISDMDILIEGLGNPLLGVYEFDCSQVAEPNMGIISTPVGENGPVGCVQMAESNGIVVTPGTEYHILVSSSTNELSDFTLNIKLNAPPENDDPCITSLNPPFDLTGGGSHTGTTCCARGPNDANQDGSAADFPNADCNATTEDAAVWYIYTPTDDEEGYDIILSNGGANAAEGPMSMEIYTGTPDAGCGGGLTFLASSCNSLEAEIKLGNCFRPGDVLFIKVTTDDADENCGEFTIEVTPASCGQETADNCVDLADQDPIMPETDEEFEINYICFEGCLDYACPEEDALGGCGEFTQAPTVWFQVTTDLLATQMFTTVEAFGTWDPIWSVYSGETCDDLEIVNFGGSPPCSNGDTTPELHQVGVSGESNYWIAITLDPSSLPDGQLDDGSFELCVATTITAIICLGEEIGDCTDPTLVMEVTDREVEDQPLTGPFCQGEEVTINVSFLYDASESGADWLIGIVPIFGDGWDLEGFDFDANAPMGNGMTAQWYVEGSSTAPIIQEPNPILCTFVNEDGALTLCNQLCDPCPDCPQSGMEAGDPLPSGYFWVTNGNNGGCDNDGSPGEGWGIGSTIAQIDWEFTLRVKEFDNPDDCFNEKDLSVSFQTFSDGVAGCWEDPQGECILDRAMFSPAWEIECGAPPAVEGPDQEVCFDVTLDLEVGTVDGSGATIQVDVEDNPFVDGEMSHTFPGGSGIIDDQLTNNSGDVQIVIYNVYSIDESLPCPGVTNQIEVTIYPELEVMFPPVFVCDMGCTDISPTVIGGQGEPYFYDWSTGENTSVINVCPVVSTTYTVTVSDGLGCSGTADVQVEVKPPVEITLPPEINVCKDDNFDFFNPDYIVCLDFLSGSAPYTVDWVAPPGLVGEPGGSAGECFIIDESSTSEFGGDNGCYTLVANVTDVFGCMESTEMLVKVTGELILVPEVLPILCGETQATIRITGIDAAGNDVTLFRLFGGCMDDDLDFLDEQQGAGGVATFASLDLLSYTCYTIVGLTDAGCQATIEVEIPLVEGTPIEISGTDNICIGESAQISITNGSEYVSFGWTPDLGNSDIVTFNPTETVTVFVQATDAAGCVAFEEFTVTVNEEPNLSLSGTVTYCEGSDASVTATGGVSYMWTGGVADISGDTYTSSTDGETVTVTATDINGCTKDSTITFVETSTITIELGNVDICDGMGDTVRVNENYVNIEWIDLSDNSLVSDTTFYVITEGGSYQVTALDGPGGCNALGDFTVVEFSTPIIMVSDTVEVCREDSGVDSLCVNFNGQVSGATGIWTQDGAIPGFTFSDFGLDNVCFEGIQTGCYPFTFTTDTAQEPCMDVSMTMTVCVKACPCPSPATQAIPDICNLGNVNLELAEVTSDAGTWSVISGPPLQDITGLITDKTFAATGIIPGVYTVRFTLDNPGGPACEEFTEQTITVLEEAMISPVGTPRLCNIAGGEFPTDIDLFDFISVDGTDGGTWTQTSTGDAIPLTGANMSEISGVGVTGLPQTVTFEYTSPQDPNSPCPPPSIEISVLITDCNCPFVFVNPDTLCNNGVAIDLNTLLENPDNLSGTWTSDGPLVGSMFDPNMLTSGLYEITFTLDQNPGAGCDIAYSNSIIVRRQSVAVPKDGPAPCTVDTGNGPTTSNLYDWLESGFSSGTWMQTGGDNLTFTDNGLGEAIVDFVGQDIGEMFTFEYTTTDADDPCTNVTATVVITVIDCNCPPIMITQPAPVCNDDDMIDLCALTVGSDPGTFMVMTAGGTDLGDRIDASGCMFDVTGLNAGTYTIIYTLDQTVTGTCTQSVTITFDVSNFLVVTIEDPDPVCNDPDGNGVMSIDFTSLVSNAAAGTWADVDGANVAIATLGEQQNVSFINVPVGDYEFTYTIDNAEPCEDLVLTMTVTVIDDCNCPPANPLDPADECNTDGPIDLTQYDDPTMPGTWSSVDLTVENGNSLIIDGVAAGNYTLIYTITDPMPDCPETEEVMISIGEPGNAGTPLAAYTLCEGDAQVIVLDDRLEGADDTGEWTETSATSSTGFAGNEFNTANQMPGTYTFEYTLTGLEPCPQVSETVTVIIEPNPTADAGSEKFIDCENTTADIGGMMTTSGDNITYTWINLDTNIEVATTATTNVTDGGNYQLTVINSLTGCRDSAQVVVNKSDDLPTMIVTETDITCNGDNDGSITLSNQEGGDGNYTYSLNGGAAVSDPSSFTSLTAGEYTITIMDGIGCEQEYEFTIEEPEAVSVAIEGEEILTGEPGDEFTLTIDPVGATVDSVVWSDFNDPTIIYCSGSVAECTSITISPTLNTTSVYVEVFDENGCTAFDQVQIQLQQIVDIIFPNIISPNGDNINDWFFIASNDVETVLSMRIFDRWGEKIWEKEDFDPRVQSEGWNGKFNGSPVVSGVYVFTVEVLFNDLNSTRETFSGDITVTDAE